MSPHLKDKEMIRCVSFKRYAYILFCVALYCIFESNCESNKVQMGKEVYFSNKVCFGACTLFRCWLLCPNVNCATFYTTFQKV